MQEYSQSTYAPVIEQTEQVRSEFLVKVYQHLGLAIGAFVFFEYVLFSTGIAERMGEFFFGSGGIAWLVFLGGIAIASGFLSRFTYNLENQGQQYIGLFATVALESLLFAPFLWLVYQSEDGGGTISTAVIITAAGFAGLSAVAFFTKKDLSFLKPILTWGFVIAMIAIGASLIFGFNLGTIFSLAMIALAGGSILFQTQKIYRSYPATAYVGAAAALFGSLMLLFWYVLRIVMDR